MMTKHHKYMTMAIALSKRGLGNVWPNPSVGAVLVKNNRVIGRGWTTKEQHAEIAALKNAPKNAVVGATLYVSLEPCAHTGKTPPCVEALIKAKIGQVVVATTDPDPRVNGKGIQKLKRAGFDVITGIAEEQARAVNQGFFLRVEKNRPLVTLKLATTMDSKSATHSYKSQWITGQDTRNWSHGLRASHDAILIGIKTAIVDNPELTCRLPGLEDRTPVRIVLDSRLRLPLTSRLAATAHTIPTWLVTLKGGNATRLKAFLECGIKIIELQPDSAGLPDITVLLPLLAKKGITRLLVEGGATVMASFIRNKLADHLFWCRASSIIGGDGLSAIAGFGIEDIDDLIRFKPLNRLSLGDDTIEEYQCLPA